MRNYFLGSVGKAELFKKVNGELVHFASAKTLTESSINLSVSAEEVRGGEGAQLLGQFFHTSNFGLTMTDSMFHLEYVAAQVGRDIIDGGYGMVDDQITVEKDADNQLYVQLNSTPISLLEGTNPIVWYNAPGKSEYATWEWTAFDGQTAAPKFQIPGAEDGDTYCVHYFTDKAAARTLIVNANFVPSELIVFLTTRLFAGDASAPETGKPVGSVTVKIPRFQLNGTMDIAMAMASPATVQMQGTALAYDDDCNGAKYAEIVEFIEDSEFAAYEGGKLIVDEENNIAGGTPVFYAVAPRQVPLRVSYKAVTNIEPTSITEDNEGKKLKVPLTAPVTAAQLECVNREGKPFTLNFGTVAG